VLLTGERTDDARTNVALLHRDASERSLAQRVNAAVGRVEADVAERLEQGAVGLLPWESFQTMTDTDLCAIYRYFQTLPPAATGPDPRERKVVLTAQND
jgi:hypothetical protein